MKPFWAYILRCADGSYYTGHTDDIERRVGEHQTGICDGYTRDRRPVELAWSQECVTREEALAAEIQIKGWGRKEEGSHEWARLAGGKQTGAREASAPTNIGL